MKVKLPFGRRLNMSLEKTKETPDVINRAQELLKKYMDYMTPIHEKMIENEQWYKSRHWEYIRNQKYKDDPEPTTAFVLSTVLQKHADAMDYYPKPNLLPRAADDTDEAKRLSEIIPVELEWNDFYDTWDKVWYDKLKLGSGIYGVLFDPNANNGIGGNVIKSIDPINFYCDPFVSKLSDSKGVFISALIDKEDFAAQFPDNSIERAGKLFEPKNYLSGSKRDTTEMILVIDYYYLKANDNGEVTVQFLKFAGDEKLYWSEEDENYSQGYYAIDQYPFEIDCLYPEKDNIFGFGIIDVIKSPQIYVDKLDQIILANTFAHSRSRFFATPNAGINEEDLLDPSKPIVKVSSLREEVIREWKIEPTAVGVYNHRQEKIQELKDISSTNEFSRGETGGGVTAAQAIVALQKASGKTSRAMISKSYSVFGKVIYIYIELMRQFYDVPREYRIDDKGQGVGYRFEPFDNANIQPQVVEQFEGENGPETKYRKPVFDIKVEAEKKDPFSQAAQNEMAKELYAAGMFHPQNAIPAQVAINMMMFEDKDNVLEQIKENDQMMQMVQQMQMENQKLKAIVQGVTGQDLGVDMGGMNGNGNNQQM